MSDTPAHTRPRRQVVPSSRVIDPLNAGDKVVAAHRNAFALARQLEVDSTQKQQESSAASTASQSAPDPGHLITATKRSSAQASLDSTESADPKRESHPTDVRS